VEHETVAAVGVGPDGPKLTVSFTSRECAGGSSHTRRLWWTAASVARHGLAQAAATVEIMTKMGLTLTSGSILFPAREGPRPMPSRPVPSTLS